MARSKSLDCDEFLCFACSCGQQAGTLSEMVENTLEYDVAQLAKSGMKPKDMMSAGKKVHPKASKKQIIRAAFAVMIDMAERDAEASLSLQSFAISEGRPVSGD